MTTIAPGTKIYVGRRKATTTSTPTVAATGIVTIRVRYAGGDTGTATYLSIDAATRAVA